MTLQPTTCFSTRWSIFWCTTYTVDLRVFEEYLLRRLGEPPLNVTILADFDRLSEVWDDLSADQAYRLRRVNQDYLIRGVRVAGGAFHPKTYLFAKEREGMLLVGSGNLGLGGLEDGHEVFSVFRSTVEAERPAFGAWYRWMQRVVQQTGDPVLLDRWRRALAVAPWLRESPPGLLFDNWEQSFLAQLAWRVEHGLDELHVLAPFFDRNATALRSLIEATKPATLHLYLAKDVKVDGTELARVLEESGVAVHLHGLRPSGKETAFVHAKLIGGIVGGHGWVLSGSPNLSRAALLNNVASGGANIEVAVLSAASPNQVRALFVPPKFDCFDASPADLLQLASSPDADGVALPVRLLRAVLLPAGHIQVSVDGALYDQHVALSDGSGVVPLQALRTAEPLPGVHGGVLVWLCDRDGTALSNKVPVDDPERLESWLGSRATQPVEPVRGLDPRDLDTPVGRMLETLQRECIFVVEDTPAFSHPHQLEENAEDEEFWERLKREDLLQDPRVAAYARMGGTTASPLTEDVYAVMRQMLDQVRAPDRLRVVACEAAEPAGPGGSGVPWTPDQRLRVRLFNVLHRWCGGISDPRLLWFDCRAPVRNFAHLVGALVTCWAQASLPPERLAALVGTLMFHFVRSDRVPGFLFAQDEGQRAQAVAALPQEAREACAALIYASVRLGGPALAELFGWQSFLRPALDLHLIEVNEGTREYLARVLGGEAGGTAPRVPDERGITERIKWASTYMTDAHWCEMAELDLGLSPIKILTDNHGRQNTGSGLTLKLPELPDGLGDPRLVVLLRRAFEYFKTRRVNVHAGSCRIGAMLDGQIYGMEKGVEYESDRAVTADTLRRLEANGSGLRAVLTQSAVKAS